MGAAGSDNAIETADVAPLEHDLSNVAEAIHLGRRTLRMIQFNIGFALAVILRRAATASSPTGAVISPAPRVSASFHQITARRLTQKRSPKCTVFLS